MRLIPASESRRVRWKNDGGWTTELARDGDGENFRWRASIAEIESDGPFSSFPGVERDLILLDGEGIELDIGGTTQRLVRRFERIHFAGESPVECRLVDGTTRDFNVMAQRDLVRAEVVARPLAGSMMLFAETDTEWLIHVLAGHVEARRGEQSLRAESGESLHLDFREAADSTRIALDGAGELVLAKFVAVGDA